jgi:uncharacterized protein YodC (DUF2158 family)
MADNLKAGDVVQLKSGGPEMTVTQAGKDSTGALTVWCSCFDGRRFEGKIQKGATFPPEALKRA